MTANEARTLGLAEAGPAEHLAARAQLRAELLGSKPRAAFAMNKEWINAARRQKVLAALQCALSFRERVASGIETKGY
jgi:enoyl-CoA hydratase/carnithine racemase